MINKRTQRQLASKIRRASPTKIFLSLVLWIIIIVFCCFYFNFDYTKKTRHCHYEGNITCHYRKVKDDLPVFDPQDTMSSMSLHKELEVSGLKDLVIHNLKQKTKENIIFHETSCRGDLTYRQACAVESAAYLHPDHDVFVLFSAATNMTRLLHQGVVSKIMMPNVKVARLDISSYVKETPLEDVVKNRLNKSRFPFSHTSDVLRYATLYKMAGIYLDLDCVVVKPLPVGDNFAVRMNKRTVASTVLSFSDDVIGRSIAEEAIKELNATFNGNRTSQNGPGVITRVLERRCGVKAENMTKDLCKGFTVHDKDYAIPVKWNMAKRYFKRGSLHMLETSNTHIHTLWGGRTECYDAVSASPLHTLAKTVCKNVYKANPREFGEGIQDT